MKVEPIKVLTFEGQSYDIAQMSESVQRLVDIYNDWRQQETDARIEMLKTQAALRDITREIIGAIKTETEGAKEEAPAETEAASA
jgi:hypothetical protein